MPAAYQFDELPVLHGFSEEDFFRLCQDNPQLRLERAANQDIIIMPPAHPDASEDGLEIAYWWRPNSAGQRQGRNNS